MELARTPGTLSATPGPGPNANPANPAAPQVGLQSPAQPLSTPERAPFDSNGTGGAGNDTSSLGVKPSDLNTGPEASIPPAPVPVASGEASPRNSDRRHQIAEGDSFWKLSSKYYNDGTLADALKAYNQDRIGKNGQLRIGASLLIPEKSALTSGKPATASEPKAASKAAAKPESRPEPRPAKSDLKVPNRDAIAKAGDSGRKASRPNTYTVRKGDTLEKIAVKFLGSASRVDDLMAANPGVLSDEDDLKAGAVLKIPAR